MVVAIKNLITTKVRAKNELLFNKPVSETGLLSKSSCLAPALGATKYMCIKDMILVTLGCAT